jgi:small neutral amino acid transporter SnatA (MarC family)
MDRIIGAFTFRKGVYEEVEHDTTFTTTAYIIVAVVALLSQLGANANAGFDNLLGWAGGTVVGTVFALIAFAIGVAIVNWVGRTVFNAEVTFDELVRTLGLAYVWQAVGVLGVLGALGASLACVVAPVTLAASLAFLVAWFVAAKEALDLEWIQVIVTVVIAWVVVLAITLAAGLVIGLLGFGAAAAGGLLG